MKRAELEKKMADLIAKVTLCPVEVVLLTAGRLFLSIVIEGNNTAAVDNLRNYFGSRFDCAEYDAELDCTYAGLNLSE